MVFMFLCILLASLSAGSWGQSLDRLARDNDPTNEDFTGKELVLTEVGSGMPGSTRPLICYTTDTTNVKWLFPTGDQIRLKSSKDTPPPAAHSAIFSWNGSGHGLSLHRGPDFYFTGEYCCVRNGTTQRLCVTLTWPPLERIARSSDPPGTDFSGDTLGITDVGSGAPGIPRPLSCYTQDTFGVRWMRPYGIEVLKKTYFEPASNSSLFSWDGSGYGLCLHRGPDFLETGEYCCERSNTDQRLCVTLVPSCGAPPSVLSASFQRPLKTIVGTTVKYRCNSGLTMVGFDTVTCLESGYWSSPPSCTAIILLHGTTVIKTNNTEVFITDIGRDVSLPSLRCLTDLSTCCGAGDTNRIGRWTYPNGSSVQGYSDLIDGNQPFYTVRNTIRTIRLYRRHEKGFSLSPTGSYCCTVPTSQGEQTLCASIVVCPSLPPLFNGMITYSDPTFGEGTVATYSCNPLFPLIGTSTRICKRDNRWYGKPPHCRAFCRDIADEESLENYSITYNSGITNDRPVHTVATYNPLSHTDNVIIRRCLNDGTWSGSAPSFCRN